jgi:AraC family transcriptional regulator
MSDQHFTHYLARMRRVLDRIDAAGHEALDVAALAAVAAFSPFHFQRQFSALLGMGVGEYQRQVRLRRAAMRLAHRSQESVTAIALDAGYGSNEAFARAFRSLLGQSPSAFRDKPDWKALDMLVDRLNRLRSQHMPEQFKPSDVAIVDFPQTRLLTLEHRGAPAMIGATIQRFIELRRTHRLRSDTSATFNLFPVDPVTTPDEDFQMMLGVATPRQIKVDEFGSWTIPAMRVARIVQNGSPDNLGPGFDFLYGQWLPSSGEEMRDHPPFVRRVSFYPDVPLHEAVTELYLPLA